MKTIKMSVNIIVTESVIKTDYYISLYGDKKVSNITVDIDIDEHFVNLYFSIQDNLKEILNSVVDNGEYDIYDVMCIINDFFYIGVNPLFPFEIAVYLIKNGYKEHFINDSYYLALLYETPEIYNVVIKNIENNCLDEDLIYLHDDSLSYKNIDINKYDDYNKNIYTGWYTGHPANTTGRKAVQDIHNAATVLNENKTGTGVINNVSIAYTNTVFPTGSYHILSINY